MRHPSARSDGRGHLSRRADAAGQSRGWLLVGNSRWHWAEASPTGLRIRHRAAAEALLHPGPAAPAAWAAVGHLPAGWSEPPPGRVLTADVPLQGAPAWLGVDRALAGWLAWQQSQGPVLVADAGTVLSLTRVDAGGGFAGGRLMAGLGLQLRAMAEGTAALAGAASAPDLSRLLGQGPWPADTGAAMAVGVVQGLAAALALALRQARAELPGCRLVLSGGDASPLLPPLRQLLNGEVVWEPDLALRGLVALRPASPPPAQVSPRSAST